MAIADDFTVDLNGDIRYTGSATYYTVLELHRYLQALADDEVASGNDLLDITSLDSSNRSTDNIITLNSPYNIDDDAAEQLYDGSITQAGGDVVYSGLVVVGAVESGTELILIRNNLIITSWWGTGINSDAANNVLMRTLIRTRGGVNGTDTFDGMDIDSKKLKVMAREFNDKYAEFSLTMGLGNSTAAIFTGPDLNNITSAATVAGWGTPPTNDNEGYNLIDLNNGNGNQPYYSKWDKNAYTINQLYEQTKYDQRRGTAETLYGLGGAFFRGITHQWDYDNETGALTQSEILTWGTSFAYTTGTGAFTLGEMINFVGSGAVGQLIYDDGPTTGNMVVMLDPSSATPLDTDTPTGVTSTETCDITGASILGETAAGGTGLLLADDATDTVWIQLLTGSAPVDPLFAWGRTSENSNQVNGSLTSRTITAEFFGQSTGTAIIGSFGIGVEAADLLTADSITDLLNVAQSPPNNQTFTVSGLESTEDYVIVAVNDGSDEIDYDQLSLDGIHNSGTQGTVTVVEVVPTWTPQIATIRVKLDSPAVYKHCAYSSWTGKVFTLTASEDFATNPASDLADTWIALIDKLADAATATFTGVYSGDESLVGKVRDGKATPIQPFKTPATFTSGGGGFTAIRNPDS